MFSGFSGTNNPVNPNRRADVNCLTFTRSPSRYFNLSRSFREGPEFNKHRIERHKAPKNGSDHAIGVTSGLIETIQED